MITAQFSPRYLVVGLYLDRDSRVIRLYPVPFVRITIQKKGGTA